ncbi:MAG TPA: hypothetical protein VFP89_02210 [Propionibacteriaceae bacterium]|nr:hypothetical protein [Propionibacteriaceae bacterium]
MDAGDVVLVESPSYLAALQCFALAGATLVVVPSGPDGVDLGALESLAEHHRPKAFYTVPTFANPTDARCRLKIGAAWWLPHTAGASG